MLKACLILVCLCVCGLSAETLRVATFNLRNYLVTDRTVDASWRRAYPKPESERQAVYRVIQAVDPDILAVQEIGGADFLQALRDDLGRLGVNYRYAYLGDGEDSERRIAVLSKFKPASVRRHDSLDFPYLGDRQSPRRGLLELRFEDFGLYVLHLKSRYTSDKRDLEASERRLKEARAIRDRIREQEGEGESARPYLVLGDFNDAVNSSTLKRFMEVGDRTLAQPVDVTDSRGELWTYFWDAADRYERIDFILASPAMFRRWEASGRSGGIFDGPDSIQASDHRLVWADFGR